MQEGERRWEVVGPGGRRKRRSQSEKELMEPVAAGFRSWAFAFLPPDSQAALGP